MSTPIESTKASERINVFFFWHFYLGMRGSRRTIGQWTPLCFPTQAYGGFPTGLEVNYTQNSTDRWPSWFDVNCNYGYVDKMTPSEWASEAGWILEQIFHPCSGLDMAFLTGTHCKDESAISFRVRGTRKQASWGKSISQQLISEEKQYEAAGQSSTVGRINCCRSFLQVCVSSLPLLA